MNEKSNNNNIMRNVVVCLLMVIAIIPLSAISTYYDNPLNNGDKVTKGGNNHNDRISASSNDAESGEIKDYTEIWINNKLYRLYDTDSTYCELVAIAPEETYLIINDPLRYEGKSYPVISLGDNLLKNLKSINALTIPSSVKEIGANAFSDLTLDMALEFDFNPSPVTVGRNAFANVKTENCVVESNLEFELDDNSKISVLSSLTIGGLVNKFDFGKFDLSEATDITVENFNPPTFDLSTLDSGIFSKVTLHVPYGREYFYSHRPPWSQFTNIVGDAEVSEEYQGYYLRSNNGIKEWTIMSFNNREETMRLPDYAPVDGKDLPVAFLRKIVNRNLRTIYVPATVEMIYTTPFIYCENLEEVILCDSPDSLLQREEAFYRGHIPINKIKRLYIGRNYYPEHFDLPYDHTSTDELYGFVSTLEEVVYGPEVTDVWRKTLALTSNCEKLKTVTSLNPEPPNADLFTFFLIKNKDCILHVPEGSVEKYKSAPGWMNFKTIVGDASGIDSVTSDDNSEITLPIYYNLNGVRIDNPKPGEIVMRIEGNKVYKQIF